MKSTLTLLALVTLIAPLASQASPADVKAQITKITSDQTACLDKATSQVDMDNCTNTAYVAGDKILNVVYRKMVKDLSAPDADKDEKEILKRLVRSERAWVSYREAQCDYVGTTMLGGSGERLQIASCQADMTFKRVLDLTQE